MKFFVDTANVEDIKKANDMGVICGVTTNPSLIAKEGRDFNEVIKEITSIVDGPISGEVKATTVDAEGMIKEGREIAAIHPNMVVKIPMTVEGLKAVKVLSAEGIKTNVTLIFSANQAILAANAGATYVSPFLGRLDDISQPGFVSCTPAGIVELLKRSNIEIEGKECVVVGRSNIVGKPMALLLLRENGTVTIAHSRTKNLKEVTKRADILVVAIGKPKFITKEYVKEGAVVIDVGIHRLGTSESGKSILCGDVDYDDVFPIASAITPVPGGVGPMTIAMLMNNCVHSVELQK